MLHSSLRLQSRSDPLSIVNVQSKQCAILQFYTFTYACVCVHESLFLLKIESNSVGNSEEYNAVKR